MITRAGKRSRPEKPKLIMGYDIGRGAYIIGKSTEWGTIDPESAIGVYPTWDEARVAAVKMMYRED